MRTRVQKWGNSLAVRIPKPFAEGAGLRPSSEVEVSLEKGEVRLSPVRPRWKLRQLLAGVTKRNLHTEVDVGPAVGREAW
ncbi:MAG: AbrB/MazE/SpoVT family DNA-binding domain-containing protein [Thermoanaerobaculia bacterium]